MLLTWVANYMSRTMASPAVPIIINEFGISYELAGLGVLTILFVGYLFNAIASRLPRR
jgi:hypothetical protein